MFVVLGANGHVGRAVVEHLIAARQPVIGITHTKEGADRLRASGAFPAVVDVMDTSALRAVLQRGKRAFLLNPPADVGLDTDQVEEASARSISEAIQGLPLEKVVVESTYGAQPGDGIGDLSVLYHFETQVAATGLPAAINRGAYYYSNFDLYLPMVRDGVLAGMLPELKKIPMVAPDDLGRFAAQRLMSGVDDVGVWSIEGPETYSLRDVADTFERLLGKEVRVEVSLREQWVEDYKKAGFSEAAAQSYARMTGAVVDRDLSAEGAVHRGETTLDDYLRRLIAES